MERKWEVEFEVHYVEVSKKEWKHMAREFLDFWRTCEDQRKNAEKGETDHE